MRILFLFFLLLLASPCLSHAEDLRKLGILQATPKNAAAFAEAGVDLVVLDFGWNRFEPKPGESDRGYVAEVKKKLTAFRDAGLGVILDLGMQYPPEWLFELPESRYRNQFGVRFADGSPGMNVANSVFNREVRAAQERHMQRVFEALGTDFYAVRLGGGWYGELNYPPHQYGENANCYWAFDEFAQGKREGLPEGMQPCPVPGWIPGARPVAEDASRKFVEWYLDCLRNYHDWQIATVRKWYPGKLTMLYPSWGIRPGQLDAAIAGGLSGDTPPERNGEIQRGFDFSRFIAGIRDPGVMVHCTWADASPTFGDDYGTDPAGWSPVHFLASLAAKHDPPLGVSAENTGGGGMEILELCAERIRRHQLSVFLWAFEADLFDGKPIELRDLKALRGGE